MAQMMEWQPVHQHVRLAHPSSVSQRNRALGSVHPCELFRRNDTGTDTTCERIKIIAKEPNLKVVGAFFYGGWGGRREPSPSWMLECARGSRARSCSFPDVPSGGLGYQRQQPGSGGDREAAGRKGAPVRCMDGRAAAAGRGQHCKVHTPRISSVWRLWRPYQVRSGPAEQRNRCCRLMVAAAERI